MNGESAARASQGTPIGPPIRPRASARASCLVAILVAAHLDQRLEERLQAGRGEVTQQNPPLEPRDLPVEVGQRHAGCLGLGIGGDRALAITGLHQLAAGSLEPLPEGR